MRMIVSKPELGIETTLLTPYTCKAEADSRRKKTKKELTPADEIRSTSTEAAGVYRSVIIPLKLSMC
jgi:hypothetical protein